MKKKTLFSILAAAITLISSQAAVAQGSVYMYDRSGNHRGRQYGNTRFYNNGTYLGFRLGVNAAQVNSKATYLESNSSRAGLVAGIVVGQQLVPHAPVLFETGLLYSEKGGKSDFGGDFSYNLNYLEVPLTFKYAIQLPSAPYVSIQPMMGAYFGLGVGG